MSNKAMLIRPGTARTVDSLRNGSNATIRMSRSGTSGQRFGPGPTMTGYAIGVTVEDKPTRASTAGLRRRRAGRCGRVTGV